VPSPDFDFLYLFDLILAGRTQLVGLTKGEQGSLYILERKVSRNIYLEERQTNEVALRLEFGAVCVELGPGGR
jgi:hypothetical protein